MNKDFEKAYKELARIEAPDLWDRIEAGITERSASAEGSVTIERIQTEVKDSKKGPAVILLLKRYSALAAALLCAVIIIPVMGIVKQAGGSRNSASAKDTSTAEETYISEESCTAEEACTTEEAAVTEMSASTSALEESEEEAVKEEFASGSALESDVMEEAAMEDLAEAATEDSVNRETKLQSNLQKTEAAILTEGQKLTNVYVEITDVKDRITDSKTADEMGTLYTAVVHEDPSEVLTEGEQIVIFIPVYSSLALSKDGIFELDIVFCENEDYSFTVAQYHEQTVE